MLVRFRNWLNVNKVFFDVSQNVLLGLMAISISWYSLKISIEEHKLNQSKSLPAFKIIMTPVKNTTKDFYDTYNLEVDNDGERISNFNCDIYNFLKIDKTCARCPEYKTIQFQINDYYSGIYYTHNHTGKLLGTIGNGNNLRLSTLQNLGRSLTIMRSTYLIDLISLVKISYKDVEQNNHIEYWEVSYLTSNSITENQFKNKIRTSLDSLNSYHPSLFNLKIDDIENMYSNLKN